MSAFVDMVREIFSDQQLYIDVEQEKLFDELRVRGRAIEERYLGVWKCLGDLRKDLDMSVDLFADDKEVISRELAFLDRISASSASFREKLYESPFLKSDPISLMDVAGLEIQRENVTKFTQALVEAQT